MLRLNKDPPKRVVVESEGVDMLAESVEVATANIREVLRKESD